MRAIRLATENMGDFKLKTAKDFTVPEHLRMNAEKKRAQLVHLEEMVLGYISHFLSIFTIQNQMYYM